MLRSLGSLVCILTLLAGCGGEGADAKAEKGTSKGNDAPAAPKAEQSAEPKTAAAATATAKEQTIRYTSGDFAGAWDMWTDDAKGVFSREDYVKLSEACAGTGIPLEVDPARLEGGDQAVVRVGLGNIKNSYKLKYIDGQWKWQPDPGNIKVYKLGLQGAIKARKAEGSCDAG